MASEVRAFAVTVPAGTAVATPQVTALTMPARIVRSVRVRFPPGCNGLVGFALGSAGTRVIPWNANAYIVDNDRDITWELERQIQSGAWQVQAYNTGAYPHTLYFTFLVDPPQLADQGGPLVFPSVDLSGGVFPPGDGGGVQDGYAMGKANAIAAVELALGATVDATTVTPPVAGTPAAGQYAAARQAALDALGALTREPAPPPPPTDNGYSMAKGNALAAVEQALGAPLTVMPVTPPPVGDTRRAGYDAGARAALVAVRAIVRSV